MMRRWLVACVLVVLAAGAAPAQDVTVVEKVQETLGRAAAKLGLEFRTMSGARHAFSAAIIRGLETCDRIDLEVRVREGGVVDVVAYPRIRGERIDPRRSADRPGLVAKLGAPSPRIAPLVWVTSEESAIHASCSLRWEEASAPDALERALLATPAIDGEVAKLLPALRPALSDEDVAAKLREAAAADEAGRSGSARR